MSHEVESMMFAKRTPWHGLGTYVGEEAVDSATALKMSGLDWRVKKMPVECSIPFPSGKVERITDPNHFVVVRNTDLAPLGVVGSKYSPFQNTEAFSFLDGIIGEGKARYDTAGSLKGGKVVWMLAELPAAEFEIGRGDNTKMFLLLRNSHDGTSSLRCMLTAVRVVCANTLRIAIKGQGTSVAIRHTGDLSARLEDAQRILGLAAKGTDAYREMAVYLSGLKFDRNSETEFLASLVADTKNATAANKRKSILDLYKGKGQGSNLEGVAGTAWGMLNAVTEYTSHKAGSNPETRLNSQWFGQGNDLNQRARTLLLAK